MGKGKAKRHFGSGYFIVLEAVWTPAWMTDALGTDRHRIGKGIYPVKEEEDWYEVVL